MARRSGLFVFALIALAGCEEKSVDEAAGVVSGEAAKPAAFLAYEHEVAIELGSDHLVPRLDALRDACNEERFGSCSVLALQQGSGGTASLTLRTLPAAIEPIVALAAQDGRIEQRSLRAEDLADAVADTGARIAMLDAHRANLLDLRGKPGLSVGDTIALSNELASVVSQLDSHTRTAANQRRRIETNLLTMTFRRPYEQPSGWSRIGDAFTDLGDSTVEGTTEALAMFGFALPFLVIAFPLALLWRVLWRWATRVRKP